MDNIALALPLYLSTLPLLFVGMWSLVLALPAAWLQPHVEHERRLMRGFHSIMLGHALICFSYFISNNAMVSMENMTRVMIIGSALATMAVLHGLMYFIDQKKKISDKFIHVALVISATPVLFVPHQFVGAWERSHFFGYSAMDVGGAFHIFLAVSLFSVVWPTFVLYKNIKNRLKLYITHIIASIWSMLFLGVLDYMINVSVIPFPSVFWIGALFSNVFLVSMINLHYNAMFERIIRDDLTGLYTRDYLMGQMRETLIANETTVVFIDVDNFKSWNDDFGHDVGDTVLQYIASTMLENVRSNDICARYAGDEFVILLPQTTEERTQQIVEEISKRVRYFPDKIGRPITLSCGVAICRENESPEDIIKRADQQSYKSKRLGKNRISIAN